MFRKLITSLFLLHLSSYLFYAEGAIVVDSETGLPLAKASIFDTKGNIVAVCNDDGSIPSIPAVKYPITIKCLGYRPFILDKPSDETIRLTEIEYNLPEYVVDNKKQQVLHIIAYVREYSTLTTYSDTVQLFREKTVDFMLPAKRIKRYKGWTHQRVLASNSYYHFTNSEGLDSVSRFFMRNFSWSDMVGIFKNMEIPEKIRGEGNATDTVWGKYSPSSVWRKVGDNLFLDNDILADKSHLQWAPDVFRLFNNSVEFTKFNTSYQFSGAGDREVFAYNIARMAVNIESKGRGYDLRRIFNTDDPIYINTYAEIYFTEREYLTVSEAKRWEKEPLLGDKIGIHPPTDAPELQYAITKIVERVKKFDYNRYRLNSKTDRFYEVMEKYENPSSKKKKKNRSLNDLIRRNEYQQRKKKEMRIPSSNYIK